MKERKLPEKNPKKVKKSKKTPKYPKTEKARESKTKTGGTEIAKILGEMQASIKKMKQDRSRPADPKMIQKAEELIEVLQELDAKRGKEKHPQNQGIPDRGNEAFLDFNCENVVITDPCYLIREADWKAFLDAEDSDFFPHVTNTQAGKMLVASTIYGDWLCELAGKDEGMKAVFGHFTADAGLVCACAVTPAIERHISTLPRTCFTILRNFTGRILISHRKGACHVEGNGTLSGRDVEFAALQTGG